MVSPKISPNPPYPRLFRLLTSPVSVSVSLSLPSFLPLGKSLRADSGLGPPLPTLLVEGGLGVCVRGCFSLSLSLSLCLSLCDPHMPTDPREKKSFQGLGKVGFSRLCTRREVSIRMPQRPRREGWCNRYAVQWPPQKRTVTNRLLKLNRWAR